MYITRIIDFISLVVTQALTLWGIIEWRTVKDIVNGRRPARMMKFSEKKRFMNQFYGGFLLDGKVGWISKKKSFQSIMTVGGMGVGKSASLVIPNILTADNSSLVITNTSGEIYVQTSGYLKSKGYDVKVLNLMNIARSHRYNPLARLKSYTDAERAANVISTAAGGGHSSDPIWGDGAKRLLRILIRTLKNREPQKTATLSEIHRLLNNFDAHHENSKLDEFIIQNTLEDAATYEDYKGFTSATTEKMLLSFVSTATTSLSAIGNPELQQLLSGDDFDFEALRSQKTAIFIMVNQQDMQMYRFLLSLFYTDICYHLLQFGKGKKNLPVYLFLDEFGHATIPSFDIFATSARKYSVGFWIFIQSLAQLEERYGRNGAKTIMDGLGMKIYFGGMDVELAQNISQRLGTKNHEPLLRPDELVRLRDYEMIMLSGNRDPLRVSTLPYFARGDLRQRAKIPCPNLPVTAYSK